MNCRNTRIRHEGVICIIDSAFPLHARKDTFSVSKRCHCGQTVFAYLYMKLYSQLHGLLQIWPLIRSILRLHIPSMCRIERIPALLGLENGFVIAKNAVAPEGGHLRRKLSFNRCCATLETPIETVASRRAQRGPAQEVDEYHQAFLRVRRSSRQA